MKTFKNIWFCKCSILTSRKISRCSVLIITLLSVKAEVGVAYWCHFTGTECFSEVNLFGMAPLFIYTCGALQEIETVIDFGKSPLTDGLISSQQVKALIFCGYHAWFWPTLVKFCSPTNTEKRKLPFPWSMEESSAFLLWLILSNDEQCVLLLKSPPNLGTNTKTILIHYQCVPFLLFSAHATPRFQQNIHFKFSNSGDSSVVCTMLAAL